MVHGIRSSYQLLKYCLHVLFGGVSRPRGHFVALVDPYCRRFYTGLNMLSYCCLHDMSHCLQRNSFLRRFFSRFQRVSVSIDLRVSFIELRNSCFRCRMLIIDDYYLHRGVVLVICTSLQQKVIVYGTKSLASNTVVYSQRLVLLKDKHGIQHYVV